MALFPDFVAAPGLPSCSLDTQALTPPQTVTETDPLEGSSPGARPHVALPKRDGRRRDVDPAKESERNRGRDALKQAAMDAIGGFLAGLAAGDPIGDGLKVDAADLRWLARQRELLELCQQVRAFREAQCGQYLARALSCRSRVCPDDERARSARLVDRYKAILGAVPSRRRSYVVLTIRNTPRLADGLNLLSRSISTLRGRALFRGGRCSWRERDGSPGHPCPGRSGAHARHRPDRNCPDHRHKPIAGGVTAIEVTHNATARTWHPHANLLMDAPFVPQAELSGLWRAITCPDPQHRRRGHCPQDCDQGSPVVHISSVQEGTVREALKYVTKSAELVATDDPAPMIEFLLSTRGRRLVQGWGSFFGVVFDEPEREESVEVRLPGDRFIKYLLPRTCPFCGRDTKHIDTGDPGDPNTWELPVYVPRRDVRLQHGAPSWSSG